MERETLRSGIDSLAAFVRAIIESNVRTNKEYKAFAKENIAQMNEWFWFQAEKGMPNVASLVNVSFHPTEPLILLNYSQLAHMTLFQFSNGWTVPLKLCRGIVFDFDGNLVAKGFCKFFNYGENIETKILPNEEFEATKKQDGHLGIIFRYNGKMFITTRGSFVSNTSKFSSAMLKEYAKANDWQRQYPDNLTTLVEIIHPETKVLTEYGDKKAFVLIGAFATDSLDDYAYGELTDLGQRLGLEVTQIWTGKKLENLIALIKDRSIANEEGYVVRFKSGLRVKLKFETYIAKMFEKKVSYAWLMKKFMAGKLQETINILDEEIVDAAKRMLGEIMIAISLPGSQKEKWTVLYQLLPEEASTSSFRDTCRKFVKAISMAST
jgi:hypothetical protein